MPNILFVSNNAAHWPLVVTDATSLYFDNTRVPYAFKLQLDEGMASPIFSPTTNNVTWIHFRTYIENITQLNTWHMLKVLDASGNLLFSFVKDYNVISLHLDIKLYDGEGGSILGGQSVPWNKKKMNQMDVRYELIKDTSINLKFYLNGGLVSELNYATEAGSFGQPTSINIGGAFLASNSFMWVSEILVADGDTRNARMNLLRPTAEGGETDWIGTTTDLADNDPTSGLTSIAADERETMDLSSYSGAGNISSLVVATVGMAGANAPQNMRHTVRVSAVNYDSPADIPLGEILTYQLTDFQINPATSLPWVSGDLSGLEMGFVSKA